MNLPHAPSRSSSFTARPHGSSRMVVERHLVVRPLRVGEALGERGVVIDPADAVALHAAPTSASAWPLKATMSAPYFSATGLLYQAPWMPQTFWPLSCSQVFRPAFLLREHVDAGGVVERLDDADDLPAVRLVVHGRDHQVDLALLQELHAVRRDDRHELELDAELLGDVACAMSGSKPTIAPRRIAEAERLVVGLGADDEHAALLILSSVWAEAPAAKATPASAARPAPKSRLSMCLSLAGPSRPALARKLAERRRE